MSLKGHFPILIAHAEVGAQSVAGVRLRQIQHELEAEGWKTLVVASEADAGIVAGAHRGLSAIAFRAEAMQKDAGAGQRLIDLMNKVHQRAPGLPVIALGETVTLEGSVAEGGTGAAQPARHPLPVRGHGALPGAADHARCRGLSRPACCRRSSRR